ncbi:hypothetical protein VKT23_002663 [Stygiomarasmius scandens]|uniref:BTB domain-containing protein n=1 Tax=Marasmiellus scandens TaxID=2682957 RepID=A0ABR1K2P2_9AGAR
MSSAPIDPSSKYHPEFDALDADIVLSSNEGTFYRVHSIFLKTASGFFRGMLELPVSSPSNSPIPTSQSDTTLYNFLSLISSRIPPALFSSFSTVLDLLYLCESWDAPGPISILRSGITAPSFLAQPLELYRVAVHFGWEEEAKLASTHTLKLDLFDTQVKSDLSSLPGTALLALITLHRSRRDILKSNLDDPEMFNTGNSTSCAYCSGDTDHSAWREFKYRLFVEMDKRPAGEFIRDVTEMDEWPETQACWEARCTNGGCGKVLYHKPSTVQAMRDCLDKLPTTVSL